jgi:hyperosmotically inducible periplasmic protein
MHKNHVHPSFGAADGPVQSHCASPAHRALPSARSKLVLAVAALLSGVAIMSPALANSVVGATPDDKALATSVQKALLKDGTFQAPNVDIAVRAWQGKVNLSGWIGNAGDDALARKIAASVGGVKTVTSSFRSWSSEGEERVVGTASSTLPAARAPNVVGATGADLALATSVHTALLKDRTFQAADVDIAVRASSGKVNLSGWIGDAKDDALAREIAGSVAGVKKVSSNFRNWSTDGDDRAPMSGASTVAMAPAPSIVGATPADRALATDVRAAVLRGKAFQDADVDVVVRAAQGRVNLSGWVSFASNGAQANKLAAAVPGVKSVTNDFKSWSSETDPRP